MTLFEVGCLLGFMRILLIQFDGKFPNLALMRISTHHKNLGDEVSHSHIGNIAAIDGLDLTQFDRVYGSLIFEWNRPVARYLLTIRPDAILGGSGWDEIPNTAATGLVRIADRQQAAKVSSLESLGITTKEKDYSLYPSFPHSVGFTQRGCRLACGFCKVPVIEGKIAPDEGINSIWRGPGNPKNLILWDNDTFGAADWRSTFAAIREGGFKVSFNQGINARLMNEENAEAMAATPCYSDDFKVRRYYTAWDNRDDEQTLFRGLGHLVKYGVKPDNIMVYMLIGYWPKESSEDRDYRRNRLRNFGVRPYPMPFVRPKRDHKRGCKCEICALGHELVGFQRWVVMAYDKWVSWAEWESAGYRPERLGISERRETIHKYVK